MKISKVAQELPGL